MVASELKINQCAACESGVYYPARGAVRHTHTRILLSMVRAIRGLKRPGGVRQGSIAGWRGQAAAAAPGAGAAAEYRFGRCGAAAAAGKGGPGAPHWLGGGERPTRLQPRNFALQRTGCSFSHLPCQSVQPRKSAGNWHY